VRFDDELALSVVDIDDFSPPPVERYTRTRNNDDGLVAIGRRNKESVLSAAYK